MVISGDYQNLDRFELFVQSETFSEALERFEELRQQCSSNENFTNVELLGELKKSVTNWKGLALLDQVAVDFFVLLAQVVLEKFKNYKKSAKNNKAYQEERKCRLLPNTSRRARHQERRTCRPGQECVDCRRRTVRVENGH